MHSARRVKLPKTFLAVNLSDAFSFQEKQHHNDNDVLEMKPAEREHEHEHDDQATPLAIPPSGSLKPAEHEEVPPVVTSSSETPVPIEHEQAPLGITVALDTNTDASDPSKSNIGGGGEGSQD